MLSRSDARMPLSRTNVGRELQFSVQTRERRWIYCVERIESLEYLKNKIIRKTITDGFVLNVENVASTKIIILRIVNIKMEEASNLNEINIMEELLNVNQQGVTGTT